MPPLFGHPVDLHGADPALHGWLESIWGLPSPWAAGRVPIAIETRHGLLPPSGPADQRCPSFSHPPVEQWHGTRDGLSPTAALAAGFRLRHGAHGLDLHFGDASTRIVVDGPGGVTLWTLLNIALSEILRLDGLLPLHAAAIVREGIGSVLLARSGTGKSTTLLTAVGAGYAPVAEDWVWYDPATGGLTGWDRTLRLWPDSYARFADALPDGAPRDRDGKRAIPFGALGAAPAAPARLHRLVVLTRALAQPSAWDADIPPLARVQSLWEAAGVPVTPRARRLTEAGIRGLLDGPGIAWAGLRIGHTPLPL